MLAAVAAGGGVQRRPAAIYVFGDSTLDVGNNNYLPGTNVPRANRPYYGVDFPGFGSAMAATPLTSLVCVLLLYTYAIPLVLHVLVCIHVFVYMHVKCYTD